MALASGSIFAIQASATTGNTGGSGFNPGSANFNTDLAATSANTSAPVVTSASYTFVTSPYTDVGAWVYVQSGTHWQAGWYQIASVAGGAATLSAGVGAAILSIGATGIVTYNTTAGCTSDNTATLSSGTYGVDYSQLDTAIATSSTATSSGAGAVILFAGSTASMLGNFVHIISGTNATAGWYEIIAETAGVSITTDRNSTTGVGASIVMNIGGAGRLNGLENTYQAMLPAGSIVWIKNGSYTLSQAISTASTNSTATNPSFFIGYNSVRGDVCVGSNRPIIAAGANAVTWSQYQIFVNVNGTITASGGFIGKIGTTWYNCKILQTSTTSRPCISTLNAALSNNDIINCELISQNGIGVSTPGVGSNVIGNYIHDCATGISIAGTNTVIVGNLIEASSTAAITNSAATTIGSLIQNNTIYGTEAKIGIGINLTNANSSCNRVINNILYGLATGISVNTGASGNNSGQNNDFFNNTTDVTNWVKDPSDLALNPTFTNASQLTGSTATTTGSVLTDSGASFGVTDNVDYLHVISGTGVTVGGYLITSHTGTTLTVNNALGTSNAGNVVYFVTHGHNFQIGTPLKGLGFNSFTNATGNQTTSYPDVGAVQRQEPSGSSGGSFTFVG